MLGILSDTPKLGYKYYIDLLLKRDSVPDSGLPTHGFPLLADCGATNSCLSLDTFKLLEYTTQYLCTEVQYSLSNVTEQENPHTILGSILLDIEIQCKSGLSILSVHFLILDSNLQYGILGAL